MQRKILIIILATICSFNISSKAQSYSNDYHLYNEKMTTVLQLIKFGYVDTVSLKKYVDKGIVEMFKELDPHTVYIDKEDVEKTNEPLVGNFDGVGIQFQIVRDTIVAAGVINGGPSEKVGIIAGDKFLKIDTLNATGSNINSKWVFDHLRGKKGTKVIITMLRKGVEKPLEFTVTRDKIPLTSIDAFYIVKNDIGYIKLDRFAQTSMEELKNALIDLKKKGMKNLILDLRGNGGGLLGVAIELADEFLEKGKLIVYTEGTASPIQRYNATEKGNFEKGRLIVLIDEGSASASEIVSGAVQDWDRGLIIGRRSFGKGLVQKPFPLNDGSMIRLTTSRYYTPTGRCIQKPYNDGLDDYYKDFTKRFKHGEFLNADSIKFPDSLKYYTPSKRIVYGGGGIMPDIFVPLDTNRLSDYYSKLIRKGVFNNYVMQYLDNNRASLKKQYPTFDIFRKNFIIDDKMMSDFNDFARKEGVTDSIDFVFTDYINSFIEQSKDTLNKIYKNASNAGNVEINSQFSNMLNNYISNEINKSVSKKVIAESEIYLKLNLRFLFARNLYDFSSAIQIWTEVDDAYHKAVEVIANEKLFNEMKIKQ